MKTRVLIADDHSLLRIGLTSMLEHQPDMTVVGEARDGAEAVRLAREIRPDVVVMDLMMPKLNGVEATRLVCDAPIGTKVLILTSFGTAPELAEAVANGATGAFVKSAPTEEIVDAIRTVAAGGEAFPEEVRRLLAESAEANTLTDRQESILRAVADGLSNADIARREGLAEITIKKHLSGIFRKLGVGSRTEAAALALKKHLLNDRGKK